MHSLRHTLATRLMEDGTPVEQIADILGHQSVQSTGVYLKSSLGLLARCALDPDAPAQRRCHGEPRRSRWPARSRRWSRRNAPSATSTTPKSGCWPGSPRSAPASSRGWQAPDRASVEAWITAARQRGSRRRRCRAWPRRSGSWPAGWAAAASQAYVLPGGTLPRPARYVPHIYTDRELAALFAQTDRCHYAREVPFRHLVMPVLFRTIYACGLRVSEARLLRFGDVDVDAGVLQIRDAQGRQGPAGPRQRAAARTARRLPRPGRRAHRRGLVLPRHGRAAADAR